MKRCRVIPSIRGRLSEGSTAILATDEYEA
jgi:hypothetical protein